ncbi:UDP-N-acetylmuramoyl-L-alanine--D-glutamate ligase [Planctomycetota bacterium]
MRKWIWQRRCRPDFEMDKAFFSSKKVLVMGLGRFGGGVDVVKFACRAGANVTVTDLLSAEQLKKSLGQLEGFEDIEYHLGEHLEEDFSESDIVVVNPAVFPDNRFISLARSRGKSVTSQVEIFFSACPARIIGITGANGKSTTAALTAHLLKNARYENVWLSGNIGNEPMLTSLEQIKADDLVVLELSSFQLEQLANIKKTPFAALLTNLTPNHLDRHKRFENYCSAKENIFRFQELDEGRPAVSVFNAEDKISAEWFEKYNKEPGRLCIKYSADDVDAEIAERFRLPGRANLSNLAGALAIAKYFGVDTERIKTALPDFKPLPHRLELIAEIDGVRWYNDSISTTPESAISALEAFEEPKIIIAGGYDKNLPFDELGKIIAQKAKSVILIGQTAEKIAESVKTATEVTENTETIKIEIVHSLSEVVKLAHNIAVKGDVVLFSPGCASYDMFDNFQHRGNEFAKLVHQIST